MQQRNTEARLVLTHSPIRPDDVDATPRVPGPDRVTQKQDREHFASARACYVNHLPVHIWVFVPPNLAYCGLHTVLGLVAHALFYPLHYILSLLNDI